MNAATIYIVDDDEAVRDSTRLLLESYHYLVRTFESGAALLAEDGMDDCDCLLLDLHMPGMNGVEAIEALRARGDGTPAILVTGKSDAQFRARIAAAKVHIVLNKPVTSETLIRAIESAMAD